MFFQKKTLAVDFIRGYADSTKRGKPYRRVYRNIANKLALFQKNVGMKIKSDNFSEAVAGKYVSFLVSQNLMKNTVKNLWDKTKFMFRLMAKRGYKVDFSFEDVTTAAESTTAVYLTIDEIKSLYSLKGLSEENRLIVDLFTVGCCTGLRFSDYSKLTKDNLVDGFIVKKTTKTGEIVHIPVHYLVKEIIERYNGFPPYVKSQQNFNARLKSLAQKAGISAKILVEYTKGGKLESKVVDKCNLVSTHTARRSFATNAYLAGIPTFRIMLITGHRSESAFFKYIRIQKEENAELLKTHKFFKNEDV